MTKSIDFLVIMRDENKIPCELPLENGYPAYTVCPGLRATARFLLDLIDI